MDEATFRDLPYTRIVIPDGEGGFMAAILEFPGCLSDGQTVEAAYTNLNDAAVGWIEAAEIMGQHIPRPRTLQEVWRMIEPRREGRVRE